MAERDDSIIPLDVPPVAMEMEPVPEPQESSTGGEELANEKPSLRMGRSLSLSRKSRRSRAVRDDGNFNRNATQYRSLPHRHSGEITARMRKSSSMPSISDYREWEGLKSTPDNLKNTSRRLEDRIAHQ